MASNVYRGLTIEIDAKTTRFKSAIEGVEKEARALKRELKEMERAASLEGADSAAARRQMELYGKAIDKAKERLELMKKALKDGINENGSPLDNNQISRLEADMESCEREIAEYEAAIRRMESAQASMNDELAESQSKLHGFGQYLEDNSSKFERIGGAMQSVGRGMTLGVTVPIIGVATASVKAAVDIDTALGDVRKTVNSTEEDYQALKEAAVEFSKTNAVGADELLSIEALGAQLGYTLDIMSNGKSEVQEFGEVVSGLDIATNMDAETAGTQLAQFFNIMQEGKEQTSNYGSAIVELGNNFATTESDISDMAMRIAGAGKSIGLSSADVLGLSTALTSLGINAEAGGTAISTIMSNIDKDVALGTENLSTWAEVAGMSVDEFAAKWQDKPVEALDAVLKGMQANVEEGGNLSVMLDELGISSIRQTDVMKRLANSGDLMSEAVETANQAWKDNTALSTEVADRNDTLAAKFEMLRNRLAAVAEKIGKPLADALFDLIDAAEPLFEMIENGAKTFANMSKEEQQTVIKTVALIAALGPALSLFGKITSSAGVLGGALKTLSGLFGKLDMATGGSARTIQQFNAETGKMETVASKANVAMGALKGAAIGLAAAGIAVLVSAITDYVKHLETVDKATNGLNDAMGKLGSGSAVDAFGEMGSAAKSYKDEVNEAIEAQARLADSINDLYTETESNAALADHYLQAIIDAQEGYDGSAEAAARLQAAVDGYNKVTGDTITITDNATGALSVSTEALKANTEAWKANARAQAAQEAYQDIFKANMQAHQAEEDALAAKEAAWARVTEAQQRGDPTGQINNMIRQAEEADRVYEEMALAAEASDSALANAEQQMVEYTEAAQNATTSVDAFRQALGYTEEGIANFDAMAQNAGLTSDQLADKIRGAGISAQDMAALGVENFDRMYRAADGDCSKISAALASLNALGIDPKDVTVDDNGTIRLAEDKVAELDARGINAKDFAIYANDYASATIDGIMSRLRSIGDSVVNIWAGNAAGGIANSPIKAYAHAGGGLTGIVTRPVLTNVGLVGEAGDEAVLGSAIIPLSNKQHVAPFAQAVASFTNAGTAELGAKMDALIGIMQGVADKEGDVLIDGRAVGRVLSPYIDREFATQARRHRG